MPYIVGHIPLEILRYVWFFLVRGGKFEAKMHDPRYRPSPIPKGGLEIILQATFLNFRRKTGIYSAIARINRGKL